MNAINESAITVENESKFQKLCLVRKLEPATIRLYKYALQRYCDFTNMTLDGLINEAWDEEDSDISYRRRKINSYLNNFELYLDRLDLAQSSKNQIMMLVKAFYNEFDVQLPRNKRRKSKRARLPETIENLPTMEEIRRFMDYCNNVYKSIILMGLSSGMGRAEISSLTFKHFYDAIPLKRYPKDIPELIDKIKEKGDFLPFWSIVRVKTGHPYFTFSSPESVDRIIMYLEDLHHKYPDYNPLPEDNLFRSLNSNNPLTPNDIGGQYSYVNVRKGFRRVNNHYIVRSHTLRKFFATTLERNKVPHLTTRWLLGHTLDETTSAYFRADPEALREDYVEVLDQLTTDNVQIKVINKYENIKQDVETLKEQVGLVISKGTIPEEYKEMVLKEEARKQAEYDKWLKSQKQGVG